MIRRLPHFVKPDEDHTVQLRDLEEYIAEGPWPKADCRDARDEPGAARNRAIRALDVAMTARSAASVDLSEIPAHRGGKVRRPLVASRGTMETSGSDEEVFETRSRDVNARSPWATASRMGSDAATVIWIGRVLSRTYLSGFAQDGW
jgi:hypothetical protein